jgi:hypothetical protein
MAYQVIIFGFDPNNRLPVSLLATGVDKPSAIHVQCNPCTSTKRIVVSAGVVPVVQSAGGYAAGPNEIPTDTKELYVFEFPDRAAGWAWMTTNRDVLVGKTIHTVDSALA